MMVVENTGCLCDPIKSESEISPDPLCGEIQHTTPGEITASQSLDTTVNDFVVKAMSKLPGEVLHILFEQFLTHPVWHLAANCGVWIRPDGPSLDWSIEAHLRLKATILLQVLPEVL